MRLDQGFPIESDRGKEANDPFRFELIPDLVFQMDAAGNIIRILCGGEGSVATLLKMENGGKKIEELLPEVPARKLREAIETVRDSGKTSVFHFRLNDRNEERYFEARIQKETGERNESFLVIIRDMTDTKRADNYLQVIRKIFEDATEAILILSFRNDYIRYNNAFCRMFKVQCAQTPGYRLNDYAQYFDKQTFRKICSALERTGTFRGEVTVFRSDATRLSVWLTADTVYDENEEELFYVMMLTDLTELRESREMLRFTATHDVLTGLPNRRMLLNELEMAVQRSIRDKKSGAVFFIDLDNFKDINDTLGHVSGDTVLIEASSRIQSVIGQDDIVGRLGGDEFLLITEEIASPDTLMRKARKIIEVINRPFEIGNLRHRLGASIGVAIFPHDSRDRDELLQFADMAMYRAKEKGKNRYQFYSSRLDDRVRRHFTIEKALRYALENDGFYLVFQPQIDLDSELVVGMEVLLRIDEEIAGSLTPSEFIPIAEESDLILEIGRWVLKKVCQFLYRWRDDYPIDTLQISLNLSRRQLTDESWVDFVRQSLQRYRIDPERIEFEITETAFMQSGRSGYRNIRRLQELGCKISIDDFGTGYSSLATLKEFTVDKLKIDKSFIEDIASNPTDRSIVKASIAMAHAMGVTTIAEGIENDDQKKVVKLLGCKEMQGFLFSKPKRSEEILPFLEKYYGHRKKTGLK